MNADAVEILALHGEANFAYDGTWVGCRGCEWKATRHQDGQDVFGRLRAQHLLDMLSEASWLLSAANQPGVTLPESPETGTVTAERESFYRPSRAAIEAAARSLARDEGEPDYWTSKRHIAAHALRAALAADDSQRTTS